MRDNLHNLVYVVLGVIGAGLTATEVMVQAHQVVLGPPWDVLFPIGVAMVAAVFTLLPQIGWKVPPDAPPANAAPTVIVATPPVVATPPPAEPKA